MPTDRPIDRLYEQPALQVMIETAPGSRRFEIDQRATVLSLTLVADEGTQGQASRAELELYLGDIDSTSKGQESRIEAGGLLKMSARGPFQNYISPDQEIAIIRELPVPEDEDSFNGRQILFSGYFDDQQYREQFSETASRRECVIPVSSMWKRLSDVRSAQILGRWMRTGPAQTELNDAESEDPERDPTEPHGDENSVRCVTASPVVFNADGFGNRSQTPISIIVNGEPELVYVFTDDWDPEAQYWRFDQVLRYLLFFHVFQRRSGTPDDMAPYVRDGNILESTKDYIGVPNYPRPTPPVANDKALRWALLGLPRNLNVDGVNVCEAMALVCDAAGLHFRVSTSAATDEASGASNGLPINSLYIWARGAGPQKQLKQETTFADRGADVDSLLERRNVRDLTVHVSYGDVLPRPRVVGDVRRFELTTWKPGEEGKPSPWPGLLPGWVPVPEIDNLVGAAQDAAILAAEAHWEITDPAELAADAWFSKFHPDGAEHLENYRNAGRFWVLNSNGRYWPSEYGRAVAPFTAEVYAPWEPTLAGIKYLMPDPDQAGQWKDAKLEAGVWSRLPRRFLPCFSADERGRSRGVYLELSFDGGATWSHVSGLSAQVLEAEAAVFIAEPDLTKVRLSEAAEKEDNYWAALIRGNLRVRVTAVIEGDDRLEAIGDSAAFGPPTSTELSRVFDASKKCKCNRRDAANSIFAPGAEKATNYQTLDTGDHTLELEDLARGILEIASGRQIVGSALIPWTTKDYEVGDAITGVSGSGVEFWTHAAAHQRRHPDVVAVQYAGGATTLILEDFRLLKRMFT